MIINNIKTGFHSFKHLKITILMAICCLLMSSPSAMADITEKNNSDALTRFGDAMSMVVQKVKPAVVNISTSKTVKSQQLPFFDDPFFRRFFGEMPSAPQKRKVTNLGSGVIATADGYILTNNHVIDGADDILVKLADNREYKGKVVGKDSRTDIAVIKISEHNLPTMTWGDSDKLKVGEIVLAIGNPYGLNQTITMGIVSALGRSGIGITDYEDFIQTDAAINPGNSGGALVNTKGEIIGINTAIFSVSGGYQGIGFAIPANMARHTMESIINQGRVVRGYMGVTIQALTAELSKQFNLKDEKGALLVDIVEDGPADKGGLKRGDVVTEYDGKKIDTPQQFRNMVATSRPGKTVQISIIRDGKALTTSVVIGELPAEQQPITALIENVLKGVSVQELTDELLKKLGITKKIKGVVVNNIDEDSPAAGILATGDIIMEIDRKAISNLKEYNDIVSRIEKNQGILLLIMRGGSARYLTISSQ